MRGTFVLRLVLLCSGLFAQAAWAAVEPGFYVGAGAGSSNVSVTDWNDNNNNNDCCNYYYQDGNADTAGSVYVGYRIMPYLAVEVGYLDSGQPQWDENGVYIRELGDFFNLSVDLKKLEATEVSVLGILPFGSIWEAYVRGGAAFWSAEADQNGGQHFQRRGVSALREQGRHGLLVRHRHRCDPGPALARPARVPDVLDRQGSARRLR